jgi:nucleotide-binding universal stress UspA family protein
MPFGSDPEKCRVTYLGYLTGGENRLTKLHGMSFVTKTLLSGVASREIADASQIADLLIVGSNPVSSPAAGLRSTLALRLAPRTDCPLIVVPSNWDARPGAIVVGVDDDGSSDIAVDFAAREATRSGRELVLVHAWQPAPPFSAIGRHRETEFPAPRQLHQDCLDAAVARVRPVANRVRINVILQFGRASAALVLSASDASLLVVGTHRYGIIADAFLGGTSRKLLASAACPIAIVGSDHVAHNPPRGLVWEEAV